MEFCPLILPDYLFEEYFEIAQKLNGSLKYSYNLALVLAFLQSQDERSVVQLLLQIMSHLHGISCQEGYHLIFEMERSSQAFIDEY
jgi:hypothetical protein